MVCWLSMVIKWCLTSIECSVTVMHDASFLILNRWWASSLSLPYSRMWWKSDNHVWTILVIGWLLLSCGIHGCIHVSMHYMVIVVALCKEIQLDVVGFDCIKHCNHVLTLPFSKILMSNLGVQACSRDFCVRIFYFHCGYGVWSTCIFGCFAVHIWQSVRTVGSVYFASDFQWLWLSSNSSLLQALYCVQYVLSERLSHNSWRSEVMDWDQAWQEFYQKFTSYTANYLWQALER